MSLAEALVPKLTTLGSMTIPLDYNDVAAVDPPAGITFATQGEVDAFLAVNLATNFKHVQKVWEALPYILAHPVTVEMAAGIHRPLGTGTWAWEFSNKQPTTGSFTIQGDPTYTTEVASQSVTGVQLASRDPYIDVGGTPYAGLDVDGMFAVLSTGQTVLIHDHTDSRLYVTRNLSPDPTGGTVVVATPSTIMRDSLDDVNTYSGNRLTVSNASNFAAGFVINDLLLDPFGVTSGNSFVVNQSNIEVNRFILDQLSMVADFGRTPNGNGLLVSGTRAGFTGRDFSHRGVRPATSGADNACIMTASTASLQYSFIGGSEDGVGVQSGAQLTIYSSVIDQSGVAQSINVREVSKLRFFDVGAGVRTQIRKSAGIGINVEQESTLFDLNGLTYIQFSDCTGPCVQVLDQSSISWANATEVLDGGGNLDVGIEIDGSVATVTLNSGVAVTGANGDVRIAGQVVSYAEITSRGPITDGSLNSVRIV
jgi:hypothetical protein